MVRTLKPSDNPNRQQYLLKMGIARYGKSVSKKTVSTNEVADIVAEAARKVIKEHPWREMVGDEFVEILVNEVKKMMRGEK